MARGVGKQQKPLIMAGGLRMTPQEIELNSLEKKISQVIDRLDEESLASGDAAKYQALNALTSDHEGRTDDAVAHKLEAMKLLGKSEAYKDAIKLLHDWRKTVNEQLRKSS